MTRRTNGIRRARAAVLFLAASIATPSLAAPGRDLLPDMLFDLCASPSLAEAIPKANALGWSRLTDARLESWRSAFLADQGGRVEAAAWQRSEAEGADSIAFWAVRGPRDYRACAYTTRRAGDLRRVLRETLGPPADSYGSGPMTVEHWKVGLREISFSRVGSAVVVEIVTDV